MSRNFNTYKTKPLEEGLQAAFSDQPLFGGQHSSHHSLAKVAVTSTTESGEKALLVANYNRLEMIDDQGE